METKTVETFRASIHMAGDVETAKRELRRACYTAGLCVTVAPETFIYTGGEEAGLVVGLVNYPRFPSSRESIRNRAIDLAALLVRACCQRTALVVDDEKTSWIVIEPPATSGKT